MSTTFGVKIPSTGEVKPIARRVSGTIFFTDPFAELLPVDLEVIAMDNSPQGIFNIGDIFEDKNYLDLNI